MVALFGKVPCNTKYRHQNKALYAGKGLILTKPKPKLRERIRMIKP